MPVKILYVAMKYDYGVPERGLSFEHYNFYDTLVAMGHEVEYFDFGTEFRAKGREGMTKLLQQRVEETKPDLMFTFLFSDEFNYDILRSITEKKQAVTFNWFADDHWRFENFSRHWAPCFTFVSTTDIHALPKYKAIGYQNALLTQWAANPHIYKKGSGNHLYDVTFVGQAYGDRPATLNALKKSGITVHTWGLNWNVRRRHLLARKVGLLSAEQLEQIANASRISQEQMVHIFGTSRINLNLSEASQHGSNQIKGRNFEIPATGGFQLSGYAERLDEFFEMDKEIVCYRTVDELREKIRYYLDHENERAAIAEAGYRRVVREHTYAQRLTQLFRQMRVV